MTYPFTIKICGVRSVEDLDAVREAGGDAVGLNTFPSSVRHVDDETLRSLAAGARDRDLLPIGLFVNATADEILRVAQLAQLSCVQLHGAEPLDIVAPLRAAGLQVLRAVRLPTGPLSPRQIDTLVSPWLGEKCSILLDADVGSSFGGQGARLDWESLKTWSGAHAKSPFCLAGGLNSKNLSAAIRTSGATAVDVASGVESQRGTKSAELIAEFCRIAKKHLHSV